MFDWRSADEWQRVWRYYQAGIVNLLFGFGVYALFVWFGLNIYVAQGAAYVLGVLFNYVTYSRYTFAGSAGSRLRFVASYVANYFVNLAALALLARVIPSPYAAGLIAAILVSAVNYFVLKHLVFSRQVPE